MDRRYVIGIGFNLFDARALVLRDDGKIMARVERKRKFVGANETINVLLSLFESTLKKVKRHKDKIIGVGLALGGIVNKKKGEVYWPQRQNDSYIYISVPFKKYLEEKFKLPVFIENDANACAWAEYSLQYPNCKNLIYLYSGIGCGIVINGIIHRGKDGGAGELFLNPRKFMYSYLGNFSFFSQWPQDLGILKRIKELIALGKATSLIKRLDSIGNLNLEDIFNDAKNKDGVSRQVIREAGYNLGVKVSFLINLLNPEVIVIGGGFEEAGDFFLKEIIRATRDYAFSFFRKNLKITLSTLGRDAASLGVAHLVLKESTLQR